MRNPLIIFAIAALMIGGGLSAPAASSDDTPLQESMGALNSGLRSFRRALKADSPDKEAALRQVIAMQAATHTSKLETPEKAAALSTEEGRELTKGYRKDLIEMQQELLKLEVLILDEDYKAADGSIRRLMEMKKAGHDKYIEDA